MSYPFHGQTAASFKTIVLKPFVASEIAPSDSRMYRFREELKAYKFPVTVELVTMSLNELGYTHGLATMSLLQQLLKTRGLSIATPEIALAIARQVDFSSDSESLLLPYLNKDWCGICSTMPGKGLRFAKECQSSDVIDPMSFGYETPFVFVRRIDAIEDRPACELFTVELCEQLGFTAPQRARVVNIFQSGEFHAYEQRYEKYRTPLPELLVRDLTAYSKKAMLRTLNFGKVSIQLIEAVLAHHGLSLAKE